MKDCLTSLNTGGELMAIEIAGMAAKAVETGKKVVEVAKKAEKVVSSVEKPVKAVEKVTADKDGNWGSDIVKGQVQKGVGEIKSGLSDKLKDYLSKDDIPSKPTETAAEVGKQEDVSGKKEVDAPKEEKNSLKDSLNKYLDSADSQSNKGEDVQDDIVSDEKENVSNDAKDDNLNRDNRDNSKNDETGEEPENKKEPENNKDIPNEVDNTEYNEDGTRELTEDEKQAIKDKLGWSDEKLKKCTIDKDGVIHYKTDRCDLKGKTSENGVPYERRRIVINGVTIEGVFPKFESVFDTELAPDNLKTKAYAKECNAALKEAIANDPELRSKFTPEQIKDIEEGRTPTGYVWHHNEEPGKMQLVKRENHDRAIGGAAHTGGNSLWGADSVDNSRKEEHF